MARHLLNRQKKLIDKFIEENTHSKDSIYRTVSVFTEGRHSLGIHDLPMELYEKIEAINDTEILYQNIERYMSDKCLDIVYS